jgi:hypothetical protein
MKEGVDGKALLKRNVAFTIKPHLMRQRDLPRRLKSIWVVASTTRIAK